MLRQSLRHALRLGAEARPPATQLRRSSNTPPLAPPPPEAAAAKAQGDAALEAERARALKEAKMGHELSGMLFPWERSAFGDRTEKLKWWQKAYWIGFACVMSYWVAEKSYNKVTTGKWHGNEPRPKGAPKPKPKPMLVKSRINDAIRGTSFVDDDDDPFEGLSPQEIEARLRIYAAAMTSELTTHATRFQRQQAMIAKEAPAGDAFEGMTPEDINDYLQREKAERQAALEAEAAEAAEAARTS